MDEASNIAGGGLEAEEARLARAAASGDGDAFATLYERYAQRAFNLALRVSGSEQDAADAVQDAFLNVMRRLPELGDRELSFGSYLFAATRNATYDLMRRQQRTRPSGSISESAVPLGSGAGGLGLDPGDPDEDPDRRTLLSSQREEIQEANARLPERQREALALRELEEMSYDEIAAVMDLNRNSVAQLISRARISLRDELRHTMLASIAASSPDCERALPLIATRDDGQLDPGSEDAAWLAAHLGGCETCGLATEAMQEAGASYRLWVPVALTPLLFRETMARAAQLTDSDWGEVVERRLRSPPDPSRLPGLPLAYRMPRRRVPRTARRRRRALVVAALAVLLLAAGVASVAAIGGGGSEPATTAAPAVGVEPAVQVSGSDDKAGAKKTKKNGETDKGSPALEEPPPRAVPVTEPAPAPATGARATGTESESTGHSRNGNGGGEVGGKNPVGGETEPEPTAEPTPEPTAPPAEDPEEPKEREPEEPPPDPLPGGPGNFKGNEGGGAPAF
ncbi:MAG: sigma-70 family RNA polymerase sigma factor [Solirubrobacterales bacterium]